MGIVGFNFYHDEPLFGLDIGSSSLKVMQITSSDNRQTQVLGYGLSSPYPPDSISEGVIINPKPLGEALYSVLKDKLIGSINTRRVVCTIPSSHTFSRPMKLPIMDKGEMAEAVRLEVEQYIPVPIDSLYLDWEITRRSPKDIDLSTVAVPKKIVDSYIEFLKTVGLEPVALEPTMNCLSRLFMSADPAHSAPSILLDFGSRSTDLAVIDQAMYVNSTVPVGIDNLVDMIAKRLSIAAPEARELKNKKGVLDHHSEVTEIIKPTLDNLIKEVQKIIRYHNERVAQGHQGISQIVLSGGGSTMPGLSQYLSKALAMPTRMMDPWLKLNFADMPSPGEFDRSLFLTVAGAASLSPKEILA